MLEGKYLRHLSFEWLDGRGKVNHTMVYMMLLYIQQEQVPL